MLKQNKEKINNIRTVYTVGHWIIDDTDAYPSELLNRVHAIAAILDTPISFYISSMVIVTENIDGTFFFGCLSIAPRDNVSIRY